MIATTPALALAFAFAVGPATAKPPADGEPVPTEAAPPDAGPPTPGEPTGDEPPGDDIFGPDDAEEPSPEPATAPEDAESPPPQDDKPPDPHDGAFGGHGFTPLPAAPQKSTGRIEPGSWRGVGWVELRIDFVAPVGGTKPARGNVLTAAGGVWAGWRPHRIVSLYGGLTTFIHDQDTQLIDDGPDQVEVAAFGRMTLVDVGVVRLYIPTKRRVEPHFDVGGFVGAYAPPFVATRATGGGRFGVGVDFWLGPTFTLSLAFDERLLVVGRNIGHTLLTGVAAGIHW